MPVTKEHLDYFKTLVEGADNAQGWHLWWAAHHQEIADLPRTQYLELKFEKVRAAAKVLDQHGIGYSWSRRGRLAAVWADHDPSVLDESGQPLPEFRREAFGGAIGAIEDGDLGRAAELLQREIRRIRTLPEIAQAQELGDMQLDGDHFLLEDNVAVGKAILEAVVSWGLGNDLTDHTVTAAIDRLLLLKQDSSSCLWRPDA
jgi:hypothetical protein